MVLGSRTSRESGAAHDPRWVCQSIYGEVGAKGVGAIQVSDPAIASTRMKAGAPEMTVGAAVDRTNDVAPSHPARVQAKAYRGELLEGRRSQVEGEP
jgi:hypothetical protein